MGHNTAQELAEILDLEGSLKMHLQVNHYPPVPVTMVQPCIDAIDAYNDGYDTNKLIELPDGVKWRGETHAPAWAIIEAHHLENWLVHAWDCDCYDCMEAEEQL
jgi:hypothetical protein